MAFSPIRINLPDSSAGLGLSCWASTGINVSAAIKTTNIRINARFLFILSSSYDTQALLAGAEPRHATRESPIEICLIECGLSDSPNEQCSPVLIRRRYVEQSARL